MIKTIQAADNYGITYININQDFSKLLAIGKIT